MAVIGSFSGDPFSAEQTGGILEPVLRWLVPAMTPQQIEQAQLLVRKAAHVFEYGVLALLVLRALHWRGPLRARSAAAWALVVVVAMATFDESRQARTESRSGSARDVALDFGGGVLALGLVLRWRRGKESADA